MQKYIFFIFALCTSLVAHEAKELIELTTPKATRKNSIIEKKESSTQKVSTNNNKTDKKENSFFIVQVQHTTKMVKQEITPKKQHHSIAILNTITNDMMGYRYFGKTHKPTIFTVHFNNQEYLRMDKDNQLEMRQESLIINPDEKGTFEVACCYEFHVGWYTHKGGKKLTYQAPTSVKKITPKFSWDTPEKILIEEAKLIAMHDID